MNTLASRGVKFLKAKLIDGKYITEIHFFNGDKIIREVEDVKINTNDTAVKSRTINYSE